MGDTKREKQFKSKQKERIKRNKEQSISFFSHRKIIAEKIAEETDRACSEY
jgi:hypothetical protein